MLKKCLHKLNALYAEATDILNTLLVGPSASVIRGLCARLHVLQELFAVRYSEARALAVAALGQVEASVTFP